MIIMDIVPKIYNKKIHKKGIVEWAHQEQASKEHI